MSRIYFHTQRDTKEVLGVERHMFGSRVDDLAWQMFGPPSEFSENKEEAQAIEELLTGPLGLHNWKPSAHAGIIQNRLRFGSEREQKVNWFTIALNTCLAIGSDPIKLMARIHGQCEIHCWAAGEDRAWLAAIIEQGRKIGVYRAECGWEAVIEMLRAHDDEPVVLSFSVCESFPNSLDLTAPEGTDPELAESGDWFYELTDDQTWALAFPALQARGGGLQLTPERWADFHFGDGATAMTWRDKINARVTEIREQNKTQAEHDVQKDRSDG